MRPDTKRFYLVVGLLTIVAGLPIWSLRDGGATQWANEIRDLKTQRLKFARAFDLLKDYRFVVSATNDRPETVESLTLSLLEAIKQESEIMHADLTALSVNEPDDRVPPVLRVEFNAVVQRAIDLLSLFDAVREVADWRPIEVRGCTLLRGDDATGLHSVCTIDLYYFPDIDT